MPCSKSPRILLTTMTLTLVMAGATRNAMCQATAPVVAPRSGQSETIRLFDGKTLNGWAGHFKHWSVEDGEIVGKNSAIRST